MKNITEVPKIVKEAAKRHGLLRWNISGMSEMPRYSLRLTLQM